MWRPFGRAGRRDLEDGLESEEDELLENEHGERRADSLTELGTAAAIIFILFLHPFSPGFVILFLFVFILYGCVRAAHQQRRLLQRSEEAVRQLTSHRRSAAASAAPSATPAPLLQLLRSGRVVVLPGRGGAAAPLGHPGAPSQLGPHGAEPVATDLEMLLTQLGQSILAQQAQAGAGGAGLRGGSALDPSLQVSDTDMAALPVHAYRKPRRAPQAGERAGAAAEGSGAQQGQQQVQGQAQGQAGGSASGSGSDGAAGAGSSEAQADGLLCSVCLEHVEEGEQVMTLPCLHMFHEGCVAPWLRQQGRRVGCPMCKTPVFGV